MNITFLVGNGFDLNLGLKTRYHDFYPYFIEHANQNNMIAKWIENGNYELWSDMEKSLGDSIKHLSPEKKGQFFHDKLELDDLLCEYLEEEQTKLGFENYADAMTDAFIRSIVDFRNGLSPADNALIQKVLTAHQSEMFQYNMLSFNYTNCLDLFYESAKNKNPISQHKHGGSTISDKIEQLIHVHGTTENGPIIAVNDANQINNEQLKEDEDILNALVKRRLNSGLGQQKTELAQNLINSSRIIAIYGMSLGETDIIWWETIYKWLLTASNNYLIIYHYGDEKAMKRNHPQRRIQETDRIKNRFFDRVSGLNLAEEQINSVKSRILISFQNELFRFKETNYN